MRIRGVGFSRNHKKNGNTKFPIRKRINNFSSPFTARDSIEYT